MVKAVFLDIDGTLMDTNYLDIEALAQAFEEVGARPPRSARDLVVGGAAKAVILSQALWPRLVDVLLKAKGFEVHYTREPKPEDAPDNLLEPIDGHNTVEGSFRDRAHPRSLYSWLELHPKVKRGAVAGMAIGVLGALRRRT